MSGSRSARAVATRGRIGFCVRLIGGDTTELLLQELQLVAAAAPTRRAEFAAGRACARSALAAVGVDAAGVALLPDAQGAVRWPEGAIGSITHTAGWSGAVAARRAGWGGISSLGLDAEVAEALDDEVLAVVGSSLEVAMVRDLEARDPTTCWSALLFAAKEAAYKASYPLTGIVLDHDQVRVSFSGNRFTATTADRAGGSLRVRGRWTTGPGVVVAVGAIRSRGRVAALTTDTDRAEGQRRELRFT